MRSGASTGFEGAVVCITGAGSGIGRATALLFARLGAKVHVTDVDAARLAAVVAEIAARGGRAAGHRVDAADPEAVEALAERVFAADGAVDVLHNNAGIGHSGPVEETTLEDWRRVLAVNLMGTVHGVHSFVPRMLDQGRPATIVNTASAAGLFAIPQMAPYCASKFGVVGLSESLAAELAPRGIRVVAVCPGIIDTGIIGSATMRGPMAARADRVRAFYRARGASADVVAAAVVDAARGGRPVRPVPRLHVAPPWLLKRLSPRAYLFAARQLQRLLARG